MRRSLFERDPTFFPIAVTGAPGSGKTKGAELLRLFLEDKGGCLARLLPEIPGEFMQAGFSFDPSLWQDPLDASRALFDAIYKREELFYSMMKSLVAVNKPLVLLIDRPLKDSEIYIGRPNYLKVLAEYDWDPFEVLNRYKAVLHFVTPALGPEHLYTQANNIHRSENAEGSRKLDGPTFDAWSGHPHHLVIPYADSIEEKVEDAFTKLMRIIPMKKAREIERKWVLVGFEPRQIPADAAVSEIEQIYLKPSDDAAVERRVRKETRDGTSVYRRCFKTDTDDPATRIEEEPIITLHEFEELLKEADPKRASIRKRRHRVRYDNRINEIDVYHDIPGFISVEVEVPIRDAEVNLHPAIVTSAVEVTGNHLYKNANIAGMLARGEAHNLVSLTPQA